MITLINKNKIMKTNIKYCIDLAWIMEVEKENELIKLWYLKDYSLLDKLIVNYPLLKVLFLTLWALFLFFLLLLPFSSKSNASSENIRDSIRLERLEVCQKAYKKSWINKQFIYEQIPAVRCSTYMAIIYAYESNFGRSRKCVQDKNCFGMKWNWYDTPKWFLTFKTEKEWREYFAKKYFQWHYKKKINQFVNNWSQTDRYTYKQFMYKNFWTIYKETEYLYISKR